MIERFNQREIDAVTNVIKNGKYLSGFTTKFKGGDEVQKFEEKFAKYVGTKYAISVNSGTSALFVSLKTAIEDLKIKPVKTDFHIPAYTFTADPATILQVNGKIVFEDIDEKTYCMTPPKNSSTVSIPTHLLGNANENEGFANTKFLIEDCCQALGTTIGGKKVGSFGNLSIFSFQETKHITTLGEGGMICSDNEELIEICAAIRNHAEYYLQKNFIGYNFRMTEAQAAFGIEQLKKLNAILKNFRSNAKKIMRKLPIGINPPYISSNVDHSFLIIGCQYDEKIIGVKRELFLEKLTQNRKQILENDEKSDIKGINMKSGKLISVGYSTPLYNVPMYKKFKPKGGCKNVEEVIKKSIWMDIHRFRTNEEISEELDILHDTVKELQK